MPELPAFRRHTIYEGPPTERMSCIVGDPDGDGVSATTWARWGEGIGPCRTRPPSGSGLGDASCHPLHVRSTGHASPSSFAVDNAATPSSSVRLARTLRPETRINGMDTRVCPAGVSTRSMADGGVIASPARSASIT